MSTEIANLALRHLGNSNEIANLLTERSQEARAARAFYDIAKRKTLRAALWPFARKIAAGELIIADLTSEWGYKYLYPSDCVFFRGIVLPGYVEQSIATTAGYTTSYTEISDDKGLYILTNQINAIFCYTHVNVPVDFWPDDFKMCLSYQLAALMAPSITGGDPFKRGITCEQMFALEIEKAKVSSFNEAASEPSIAASDLEASRY